MGLAATEQAEGPSFVAAQIASAAEVCAQQEGIVNVHAEGAPLARVDLPTAALSDDDGARATESWRRLTIGEVLDLARVDEVSVV